MYHENDLVVYGTYGVCKIIEISSKALMGKPQDYYVLKPVEDERATVFVPVRNEALVTKNMRPVLSEDQASELIEALQQAPSMWVTDGHERRDRYQRIISSGNCSELSRLVKTLYQKKLQLLKEGKKLHTSDAVSYTHLDVYKRQVCSSLGIRPLYPAAAGVELTNRVSGQASVVFALNHNVSEAWVDFGSDQLTDYQSGKTLTGMVKLAPWDVLVLKKKERN